VVRTPRHSLLSALAATNPAATTTAPTPPPARPAVLTQREAAPPPPPPRRGLLGVSWWIWGAAVAAVGLAIWRRGDIAGTVKLLTQWAHPTNYMEGRGGKQVDTIVIHTTEGTLKSAADWFSMDHSDTGVSAAHLIVGRDATVIASVALENTAYHAGDANMNQRSVGIELEGAAADPNAFTPAMMAALVQVAKSLVAKYGIPARKGVPGFIGHVDVPGAANRKKVDPGPYFPWDAFLTAVGGGRVAA
jgi:hypothetical protein